MTQAVFRIFRGDASGGEFKDYQTAVSEGMVVLDAVHQIQAESAPDLAVRDLAHQATYGRDPGSIGDGCTLSR